MDAEHSTRFPHLGRRRRAVAGIVAVLAVMGGGLALATGDAAAETIPVDGQFILWDAFPTLAEGELCDAKPSFYHDINSDTPIRTQDAAGTLITETTLGDGRITAGHELADVLSIEKERFAEFETLVAESELQACVFSFHFEVTEGSDGGAGYTVILGRRGKWELTEGELRSPGALQLSLGLR